MATPHKDKHGSATSASREATTLVANNSGRSRWIASLIIGAILALGGWVIAQRVAPHAFGISGGGQRLATVDVETGVGSVRSAKMGGMRFGDGNDTGLPSGSVSVEAAMAEPAVAAVDTMSDMTPQRAVHKTAQLSITVPTVDDAVERISTLTRDAGGEVLRVYARAPRTLRGSAVKSDVVRTTMTVRVPVTAFDQTLRAIKDLAAVVDTETVSSEDVTEEVADIAARLANKRREEESIAKILERSGKIGDVLEVTRALSQVRGEIERMEAQQRILRTQTDFAQITVQLREDVKVIPQDITWRPGAVARASLNRLVADMQSITTRAIQFIVWFMPAFLLYTVVIVVLWKVLRRIGGAIVRKWTRRQEKKDQK